MKHLCYTIEAAGVYKVTTSFHGNLETNCIWEKTSQAGSYQKNALREEHFLAELEFSI